MDKKWTLPLSPFLDLLVLENKKSKKKNNDKKYFGVIKKKYDAVK
jgi:hypothetical protein